MEFAITFKGFVEPNRAKYLVRQAEEAGFTYCWFYDSHILWRESFVSGNATGKIKSIVNSDGEKIKSATPSAAVEILGLNSVPNAGDQFQVVSNEKQAKEITEYRATKEKEKKLLKQKDDAVGDLFETLGQEAKKTLNVIVSWPSSEIENEFFF